MKKRRCNGSLRGWRAVLAAALLVAVLAGFSGGAEAACRVRLELDGATSPAVLTGTNALASVGSSGAPLSSDSKFEANVPRAWTGSLYAHAASLAACPTDRAGWVTAWPQFVLTSATSPSTYSPPLELWPALHIGKTAVAGLAGAPTYDYNISDFRVDMRVEAVVGPAAATVPTEGWVNFTAGPVRTILVNGWISSRNSVTGSRYDNLANYTCNITSVPLGLDVRSEGGRNTLVVQFWSMPILFQAISRITVFNSPYNSYANFSFAGPITAKALLDCPSYCGDYGSCVPGSGSSSVCACDCGWTVSGNGTQCIVPWGFCPKRGTNSTGLDTAAAVSPPPSLLPSPSPAPTCVPNNTSIGGGGSSANLRSVSPVNGVCPVGYDWDPFGVLCNSCPAGFSGTGCASCNSDAACKSVSNSSTSTCSLSPVYRPRTLSKVYTCDILDATVSGILGSTLDFTCNTTRPVSGSITTDTASVDAGRLSSGTPVGTTPSCSLKFRLSGMPRDAAVICTGWACQFTVNTTRAYCPVIRCECPKGCSNAEGTITEATFKNLNSAVNIACGADAGLGSTSSLDGTTGCKIELTGLPITAIPTTCKTAECIDPVNGAITVTLEAEEPRPPLAVAPIISWVPSMVLTLVALTTVLAVAAFVRSSAPSSWSAADPQADAVAKAGPVAEAAEQPGGADAAAVGAASPADVESGSSQRNGAESPVVPAMLPAVLPTLKTSPSLQQEHHHQQQQQQLLPGQLVTPACGTPRRDAAGSEPHEHGAQGLSPAGDRTGSSSVGNSASSKQTGSAAGVGRAVVALPTGAEPGAKQAAAAAAASSSGDAASTPLPVASDRVLVKELSWHGLTVATQPQRSWLRPWRVAPSVTLLEDVSGRAVAGEVLGILGPSGSGKTTLLSTLAGLVCPGLHWRVGGCVAVDGRRVAAARHLVALVGHVPQHDLLARSLTVTECVAASAVLRMSSGEVAMGRRHMEARIQEVLTELGIAHLANRVVWHGGGGMTLTGGGGSGGGGSGTLSGGERLRVAAALELVTDPPLLLLDEPLSGLDSATARATMAVLHGVATGGMAGVGLTGGRSRAPRVVVMSMHQPSEALFGALDSVLLMAAGRVAYFGAPHGAAGALAAAGVPPAPPSLPLADHLLDLVVPGQHHRTWGLGDQEVRRRMQDHWAGSATAQELAAALPSPATQQAPSAAGSSAGAGAGAGAGEGDYVRQLLRERAGGSGLGASARRLWLEMGVLTWRAGLDALRNPSMLLLHLVVTGSLGLVVGGVFADTNLNVAGAQNRVGAIFFAVMLLACFATSGVDGVFPERAIVDRDLLRRSYSILPYLTSRLVLDGVLLRALPAWSFALPFYFLMGLRNQAAAFFTFMGAFTTMSCLSGATCIGLSFMLSSPGKAVLVMNLLLLACALFSGFLANKDSIVPWLRWLVYVSPIRYAWESLVINELAPLVLNFSSPDLPQGLPAVKGTLFLSLLGVDDGLLNTDLIVLGCIYAAVVLIAFVAAWLRLVNLRGSWK
ncbi:hypothetical protein HYH02_005763 [Chlamydomonas schloesseri]|uniref:ABC transporter domain-containing protein n=1 Tax=Chlamydomonas schloesseri TaxID=2026947 RepID=A0A835WJU4_9CHLO|nr:hypothetical protein HYH02_005763 [Chlamydomonas schloesseri]|eukprot:KAG2449009.1 hypothetical protein HYH02_005763 [Chlamydomonas schloesseri]